MASGERLAYLRPDEQPIDFCDMRYLTPCGERALPRRRHEDYPTRESLAESGAVDVTRVAGN